MAGGPDESVKNASVAKDTSFDVYETWGALLKNFLVVTLVASVTWGLVSCVRYSIEYCSEHLFEPFEELHETRAKGIEVPTPEDPVVAHETNIEVSDEEQATEEGEGVSKEHLDNAAWTIFAILVGVALLRGLLLQIPSWRSSEGDGMGKSLEYYHRTYDFDDGRTPPRYEKPDFFQALRRAILTTLTVGSGGSGGIEAPVVPIGECIGAGCSRLLKIVHGDQLRIYQLAGISAAVATLLDAPFTAALFAAEIVYNARVLYRPLMYSLIGAVVAFALNNHFLDFKPLFSPSAHTFAYTLKEYLEVTVVALICSAPASLGISGLFKLLKKMIKPFHSVLRPVIGAVCTGLIGVGIWFGFGLEPQHVLGVSEKTIMQVMAGEGNPLLQVWWVLFLLVLAKAFATGFTLMAGGSAGALVPAMFLGGVFGAGLFQMLVAFGYQTDANVAVFVVAGLASALVAVVQVPLAAIALVLEVFGFVYGPPAIVACVLTYLLARRWKLYTMETESDDGEVKTVVTIV